MMYKINPIALVILQVVVVVVAVVDADVDVERKGGVSSCHLRELELCSLGSISMFQNPNGIPIAANEFNRQCEYLLESGECFQDYRENCMTKLQASLVSPFVNDFADFEQEFCTNGSRINSIYMKHAKCLREVQKKYQRPCLADLQVGFEAIHKIAHNIRCATACCNLNKVRDCILPQIEENCGKDALEFVEGLLKRAIGRTFDLTCRAYEPNSSKCKDLLPKLNQKPYTIHRRRTQHFRHKSDDFELRKHAYNVIHCVTTND